MAFLFANLSRHRVLNIGYRGGGIGGSETPSHAADAPYSQFRDDDIAHGWSGTCPWSVTPDGTLILWEGTPESPSSNTVDSKTQEEIDTILFHKKDEYDLLPDGYYWHYNDLSKASPWNVYRDNITRCQIRDDVVLVNCDQLFMGLNKMTSITIPQDLSQCESMLGMFDGCTSLVSFDLSGRDTSKVTDLRYLFRNCVNLRWVWINDIDTRNVTNMRFMFQACAELVNVDVSNFDTSSLEQIAGVFHGCTKLASVDFSKYTIPDDIDANIGWLFTQCSSIQRINFGANKMNTFHNFNPDIPTTHPYTGKWVKEDDPSIVLTTEEYVANYPNDIAPQGTYIWQVVNDTAIVQFDENGGETVRPSITQRNTVSPIHLSADGTAREGYKLIGWNTERDGSGISYPVNSVYTPTLGENVILYAQWAAYGDLRPLNYVINGYDNLDRCGIYEDATAIDYQGYHLIGNNVSLTDAKPTRAAHTFLGWSTKKADDIAYLDDETAASFLASPEHVDSVEMGADGMTVYAVWQESYSRKILNGDFEYLNIAASLVDSSVIPTDRDCLGVSPFTREAFVHPSVGWKDLRSDFSMKRYAWRSDMLWSERNNVSEIYRDLNTKNQWCDLMGSDDYTGIYQDIITMPNSIYKWRLNHASMLSRYKDTMNVLIGTPGEETPQDARRISSPANSDDPLGFVGENISTTATTDIRWDKEGEWGTYEGIYHVPEGQWVTRFTFRNVDVYSSDVGNEVDNIDFAIAYPLSYDLNGGSSDTIYTDPTANNYAGYFTADEDITLPDSSDVSAPDGLVFLGWTAEKTSPLTSSSTQEEKSNVTSVILSHYTMPACATTLYAAYAEAPSVETNMNGGGTVDKPVIETLEGKLLPTGNIRITPDSGFKISKIFLDGKLVELPELEEGEDYTLVLEDVVGKHTVDVVFADMRVKMPETGMGGFNIILSLGAALVFVSLLSIFHRKPRQQTARKR